MSCCKTWWLCRELAVARLRIHPWADASAAFYTPRSCLTPIVLNGDTVEMHENA